MELNMVQLKWFITILTIFVLLPANCWSDNLSATNSSANTLPNENQKPITIQVSSHKKAEVANSEVQRLKSHGLDSFVENEPVKDKGMWYRVYVGRFENRKAATAFAKKLVDKGIISGFWVKKKIAPVSTVKDHEEDQPKRQEPPVDVPKKQVKTEADSIKLPPSPRPTKESDIPAPAEISKPVETEKTAPKKTIPETEGEDIATPSTTTAKSDQEKSKFSIGLKASRSFVSQADDLIIYDANQMLYWQLGSSYALYLGLVANLSLNDEFSIESSFERDYMTVIDIWQLSIGPRYYFHQISVFTPYARACLVVGDLKWDAAPGSFDTGIGLEGGIGINFIKNRIQLGFEMSYKQMEYHYNKPADNHISATDDQLDMSGFLFSGALSYLF